MSGKESNQIKMQISAYVCDFCRNVYKNQESLGRPCKARRMQRWKYPDREAWLWTDIQLLALSVLASKDCRASQPLCQLG